MDRIFADLKYVRTIMSDNVVPSLLDRGTRLDALSNSVEILLDDTDRYQMHAGLIEERKDRLKLCLGSCCLMAFCLALFYYLFLARGSADDVR